MSKYGAEKITVDGYRFDSKVEAKYYEKCKEDKYKGRIKNFELQPRFTLQPNFKNEDKSYRKIEYVGDFRIYTNDDKEVIIDIKGMATPEAKMKRKIFAYKFPTIELLWLVWSYGQWLPYDQVIKERAKRKKAKNEATS